MNLRSSYLDFEWLWARTNVVKILTFSFFLTVNDCDFEPLFIEMIVNLNHCLLKFVHSNLWKIIEAIRALINY